MNGLWKLDSLSANQKLFAKIYFLTLCVSLGFSYQSQKKRELFAIVFHALLSCSVILAKKWIDFFVYWELMSLGSFLLIWTSPHKEAKAAGIRYFIYHVLGGGLLMIGCAWAMLRNTPYGQALPMHTSSLFILLACLINVGAVPFHTWVKDAYPKTSIYASPVLSVFVTKTSVFALIVLFPGFSPLIVIGACMSIYGALYALLENNLRKLLSYHIVSQVGFMVCAVGIGSTLSLQGAVSHAVCHILYKSLLFMSVGSLIYGLGREKLSSLGSLRKLMPWTFICYIIGGLSISGVPFFNGFVSKSIIIEASKNGHTWLPWILKAASIGTFLS
ncbi:MAG: hypothetical protein KDD52_01370, partial [Bdellovibrionales bacterium]|nr:hypothetical protein [Bdellovibrionales bacterium]